MNCNYYYSWPFTIPFFFLLFSVQNTDWLPKLDKTNCKGKKLQNSVVPGIISLLFHSMIKSRCGNIGVGVKIVGSDKKNTGTFANVYLV